MAGDEEQVLACAACGATIYPEHVEKHLAAEVDGQLLCRHCVGETKEKSGAPVAPEPIQLVGEDALGLPPSRSPKAIRSFGGGPGSMSEAAVVPRLNLRRPLLTGSPNATRCRTFHCKLTDAALGHLNAQINEWADADEHIEIKFATSCIGVVEGKHQDPHLIVTVFY